MSLLIRKPIFEGGAQLTSDRKRDRNEKLTGPRVKVDGEAVADLAQRGWIGHETHGCQSSVIAKHGLAIYEW